MATGNSIRIRWRLKGEKIEKEREREREEGEEGTAYWRGEDEGRRKKDGGTPWGAEKPPKKQTLR